METEEMNIELEEGKEEQKCPYVEIDQLESQGINNADVQKLKAAGFCTVMSVLMATRKELLNNVKGLGEAKLEKILEAAKKLESVGICTGLEFQKKRENLIKITTGSPKLDELLGGGIETMSITEAFGEFRTGKTQLCHTLCVTSQLPRENGGAAGKVAFIDTEGTFRPERINKIAERFGLDPQKVLENIIYGRAFTTDHMIQLMMLMAAQMVQSNYALLIVDSLMALYRAEFSGRGELADRQQHLCKMLGKLIKFAEQFNIAVVITNQVMADPSGNTQPNADNKRPIGGHILAHASTTRLYFKKGKGENRICKVYDSPCLAEKEAQFAIGEQGIVDAQE